MQWLAERSRSFAKRRYQQASVVARRPIEFTQQFPGSRFAKVGRGLPWGHPASLLELQSSSLRWRYLRREPVRKIVVGYNVARHRRNDAGDSDVARRGRNSSGWRRIVHAPVASFSDHGVHLAERFALAECLAIQQHAIQVVAQGDC